MAGEVEDDVCACFGEAVELEIARDRLRELLVSPRLRAANDKQHSDVTSCFDTLVELVKGRPPAEEEESRLPPVTKRMLAAALVNQVATSIDDPSRDVSSQAAWGLFADWLSGPRHPGHEAGLEGARAAAAEAGE